MNSSIKEHFLLVFNGKLHRNISWSNKTVYTGYPFSPGTSIYIFLMDWAINIIRTSTIIIFLIVSWVMEMSLLVLKKGVRWGGATFMVSIETHIFPKTCFFRLSKMIPKVNVTVQWRYFLCSYLKKAVIKILLCVAVILTVRKYFSYDQFFWSQLDEKTSFITHHKKTFCSP